MPKPKHNPQHPAAQIHAILRQLDRKLHDVLRYTRTPTFDPLIAAQVMGRFDNVYNTLGHHRFCWLLLELEEANRLNQEANGDHAPPAAPPEPAGA